MWKYTKCIICEQGDCIQSEPYYDNDDIIVKVKCVPCNTEWMNRYVLQKPDEFTLTCESCNKRSNPNFVKYDWDYNKHGGKTEWFTCPHCGGGDIHTNITYGD